MTERPTSRSETKVGESDPAPTRGSGVAQRIKVTLGITGGLRPRVHIDDAVWHLDVGSSHPGGGEAPKGMAVRHLKRYASWVQNVVRQFGPYLLGAFRNLRRFVPSTRGPEGTNLWCIGCQAYWQRRVATFGKDNHGKHLSGKPTSRGDFSSRKTDKCPWRLQGG
ncbi:hypothetical protein COY60_03575 [Candidatus Gracilibacteria bacterium CG_4_10_14_0_8_um_filter_38_28]|nr:MAG: hypothetical protein COY60_03575 [Candidatus Gracilibacteria bacterium CG_4_10_14_0_8_um_filter_38_28]